MDGVQAPASGRARRLLRRTLLVAALAGAGWLLSALFAGTAAAAPVPPIPPAPHVEDELPVADAPAPVEEPVAAPVPEQAPVEEPVQEPVEVLARPMAAPEPPAPSHHGGGGLLGGLLGGLTNTVGNLTQSIAGTVPVLPEVTVPPTHEPIVTLPQLLPDLGTVAELLPVDQSGARTDVPAPAPAPPAVPAAAATAPEHTPRQAVPIAPAQRGYDRSGGAEAAAAEHANGSPEPQPVKAPAPTAPVGGTAASTTHDNSGGTHGVLSAQTPLRPPAAGFTTRSRAADVSGRITGLPATSPD